MSKTDEFLDRVCACIRAKSVHADIRAELSSHITEITENGIESGLSPEEAERQALIRMGDPEDIGLKLDKKHRPRTEWPLLAAAAAVAIIGIAAGIAASEGIYLAKSGFILIGFGLMVGLMFLNPMRLRRFALPVYLIFSAAALIFDYHWWAWSARAMFGVAFMPGFIQLAPALFMGLMFRRERFNAPQTAGLCVLMALPMVNACLGGTMSSTVLIGLSYILIFAVLSVKGNKTARVLLPAAVCLLALQLLCAYMVSPYIQDKVSVFLTGGQSDPRGAGWLTGQIAALIKSARLIGPVPGDIPEMFSNLMSEYVLVGILGRYGWLPTIGLLLAAAALIWRMFAAAAKVREPWGFALALSASAVLAMKFVINILMNFNLFPIVGIGLPIVGGGGSDCIVTFILIGTVLSVCRRRDIMPKSLPVGNGAAFWHRVVDKIFRTE